MVMVLAMVADMAGREGVVSVASAFMVAPAAAAPVAAVLAATAVAVGEADMAAEAAAGDFTEHLEAVRFYKNFSPRREQ
jgi:hypothetical protein